MNLSLDDQLKLAIACGYEGAWIFEDRMVRLPPPRKFENWRSFNPRDPDTLMRLCFELRIGVTPHTGSSNGWMIKFARESYPAISYVYHAKTPEQIADAIIECSLQVIKECGE